MDGGKNMVEGSYFEEGRGRKFESRAALISGGKVLQGEGVKGGCKGVYGGR